jgi:hypothetical protein
VSWGKGQDVIEDLLTRRHLEQVPANPDEAQYLLVRSRVHLDTAAAMVDAPTQRSPTTPCTPPRARP